MVLKKGGENQTTRTGEEKTERKRNHKEPPGREMQET
jgi:hypothetical protein